ncbi:MAG: SIS domain-containing protein [Bryobacteraceae bacterium]
MTPSRLLADILSQPQSLARCLEYQNGKGLAAQAAAAEAIAAAPTVVLSGMGSSYFAAIPLAYHLAAHGVPVAAVEASELLHYRHSQCKRAAVVLVSRSGETVEITKLLPVLRAHAARVIGVTNEAGSTLAREADIAILVNSLADEAVAVQTYTATLATLLYTGCLATKVELAAPDCSEIARALNAGWESLGPRGAVYLLARGPAMATALEGGLLFHEVAKHPATGLSAGYFRHGPVEVVDERFTGIVFASDPVTRELNLALASGLARCGGRVAVVGPEPANGCLHWKVPGIGPLLAPLVEILPVQMAALRLAAERGIVPGRFRLASTVTLSEAGFAGDTR